MNQTERLAWVRDRVDVLIEQWFAGAATDKDELIGLLIEERADGYEGLELEEEIGSINFGSHPNNQQQKGS